jgi:nitroreductase
MLKDIIIKNRSYRRFYQNKNIEREALRELVNLARLSPSGANFQPLKYLITNTEEKNKLVFETLSWAGYLKDWEHPIDGERPSAYIIVLGDSNIKKDVSTDSGIAAQSIMLGATEAGLGGCMFGSIKREQLKKNLGLPEHLNIILVLALGYPKEKVVIDGINNDESIKYWREPNGTHHVPKRKLEDIIIK